LQNALLLQVQPLERLVHAAIRGDLRDTRSGGCRRGHQIFSVANGEQKSELRTSRKRSAKGF
jgi:hypothetical protein